MRLQQIRRPADSCHMRSRGIWTKAKGFVATALLVALVAAPSVSRAIDPRELLAQCIAESGAIFYGAHWCPYCSRQLESFGRFAHLLNYVECSERGSRKTNDRCRKAKIRRYPTWEFADGSRSTGVLSLEFLAKVTGCY